jgi:hypothetical protein
LISKNISRYIGIQKLHVRTSPLFDNCPGIGPQYDFQLGFHCLAEYVVGKPCSRLIVCRSQIPKTQYPCQDIGIQKLHVRTSSLSDTSPGIGPQYIWYKYIILL